MAIKLTPARRSQLVEQLLKQNQDQWQKNPYTWGETIAKMLAQGIRQKGINQLREQEQTQEQALMKALSGERTQDFEQIAGGPPALESQSYTPRDPAKKHQQALSNLLGGDFSPDQMAGGMQIIEGMRQLNDPTAYQQKREGWDRTDTNQAANRDLTREEGAADRDSRASLNADRTALQIYLDDQQTQREQARLDATAAAGQKPNARELQIRDYMQTLDLPREQAIQLADRTRKVQVTTEGRALDVDMTDPNNPKVSEIPISGDPLTIPEPAPGQTLFGLADQATGPGNIIGGQAIAPIGAAFGMPASALDAESVSAQQFFSAAENSLIRGFSLNPRFPVAEQNRIRENIGIQPRFFDSAELMRERMWAIDRFLANEEQKFLRDSQNPSLPNDLRSQQGANAVNVKSFRNSLGVNDDIRYFIEEGKMTPHQAWQYYERKQNAQ